MCIYGISEEYMGKKTQYLIVLKRNRNLLPGNRTHLWNFCSVKDVQKKCLSNINCPMQDKPWSVKRWFWCQKCRSVVPCCKQALDHLENTRTGAWRDSSVWLWFHTHWLEAGIFILALGCRRALGVMVVLPVNKDRTQWCSVIPFLFFSVALCEIQQSYY